MYFGEILIYLFYYVTIYYLYHLSVRLTQKLESFPANFNERGNPHPGQVASPSQGWVINFHEMCQELHQMGGRGWQVSP